MNNLSWIDEFFYNIKKYIFIREEDNVLILIPNQVYKLNRTGIKILSLLFKDLSIDEITKNLNNEQKEQVHYFFCDLRSIVSGCFKYTPDRKAIDFISYEKNFHKYPILSEIALTYRCNLNCSFCYAKCSDKKNNSAEGLSTFQIKKILKIIRYKAKVPSVSFTGGEPTMRKDIFKLIKFAVKIGLRVNLISNGLTLADENFVKKLKEANLHSAQISLEAADENTHNFLVNNNSAFSKTIAGIKNLQKYNISVHTNTTINKKNFSQLYKMIDLAEGLHLERLSMNLLMPTGNFHRNQDLAIKYSEVAKVLLGLKEYAMKKNIEFIWYSPIPMCIFNPIANNMGNKSCAACSGLLSIDPLGNILPCSSLKKSMGNILSDEFEKIWFNKKCSYYRNIDYAPEKCRGCSLLDICKSACLIYWDYYSDKEVKKIC